MNSNQDYLTKCIERAIQNPKLSKIDVSEIFGIDLDTVLRISKN